MKRILIPMLSTFLVTTSLWALTGEIDYLEGTVDVKTAGGDLEWADFGTPVMEGDTLITGADGYCEVILDGGSKVTISENTVFSFGKSSLKSGEPQNVFNCAVGQISYKFTKMKDEPQITTPTAACGIRGTEFTVTAAADGSSLFVVTEGAVEVESQGKRVNLTLNEGVEVPSGQAPGEKFPVLSGSLDYAGWLDQAEEQALADPVKTVEVLTRRLIYFIAEMDRYHALFRKGMVEREDLLAQVKKLQDQDKDKEAEELYNNKVLPKVNEVTGYGLNVRYYSLSALSLRRYTMGGLYVKLRTANFQSSSDSFDKFLKAYDEFLRDYYDICTDPFLVEADI